MNEEYEERIGESDYLKKLLIKVKNIEYAFNDLNEFFDKYYENENGMPYSCNSYTINGQSLNNTFFDIGCTVGDNVKKVQEIYGKIKHKYDIKKMEIKQTDGYNYIFIGKLDNDLWFFHIDEEVLICDAKPFEEDYYDDEYVWHLNHVIDSLNAEEDKYFYKKMCDMIDNLLVSHPKQQKIFRNHFNYLLGDRIDNNDMDLLL